MCLQKKRTRPVRLKELQNKLLGAISRPQRLWWTSGMSGCKAGMPTRGILQLKIVKIVLSSLSKLRLNRSQNGGQNDSSLHASMYTFTMMCLPFRDNRCFIADWSRSVASSIPALPVVSHHGHRPCKCCSRQTVCYSLLHSIVRTLILLPWCRPMSSELEFLFT